MPTITRESRMRKLRGYSMTLLAVMVLAVSFVILLLAMRGAVPTHGIWRGLIIPAYLTMLVSAVLRTALPAVTGVPHVIFMVVGTMLCLVPFLLIDWLLGRRRRMRGAPAA
jgi:hypothetical protein